VSKGMLRKLNIGREIGKNCKMYNFIKEDRFEFCSHLYRNGVAYPVDTSKTLSNLLMNSDKEWSFKMELFNDFVFTTRHCSVQHKSELINVINGSGFWN